ncbi:putative major capsid protein [Curtobacterium phage Penoan]|nr:putative major capsid protein [Curtobacterium phage Penoan]
MTMLTAGAHIVAADPSARTITGRIVPYGPVGFTSAGATIFDGPGSITVPAELSRVKLLVQHDQTAAAVGVMSAFSEDESGADATFYVPEGAEGDDVLAKAANGLRDGLSVGVHVVRYSFDSDDNLVVHESELVEVSSVTIPAFADARATDVAAARKELRMTDTATPTAPAAPVAPVTAATEATTVEASHGVRVEVAAASAEAQPVEAGRPQGHGLSLSAASGVVMDELRAGRVSTGALSAALGEVTLNEGDTANGGEALARPQWLGEVWTASNTRRPLIEALGTPTPLTSIRVYGWKWVEAPEVAEADLGSKQPITGNTWSTTTVDSEAQDFAGGWDIARKLIDLGAPGLVETAFVKATDDYKRKSEAWVVASVLAEATSLGAQASVPAMLTAIGVQASALGSSISFVLFSPTVWAEFTALTEAEVPWWLRSQGAVNLGTTDGNAGGVSFASSPSLTGRTFLAGDRNAATFYEVGVPIRVRAENIANGGVDLGVFGYCALIVNDPRAMFTGTVAAPAEAGA